MAALALTVATALVGAAVGPTQAHAASDTVTIDGTGTGRTFDGVGAISGGGGNSRLLIDYPEPYRSQILDYLFKPGYGASLQILKVEIGGDTNSTSGSESSHEHAAGDLACDRGYEWWLMEQAKARNSKIKLAALAWGAPGHLGTFTSTATVNYLTDWLGCATKHRLTVDYLRQPERARLQQDVLRGPAQGAERRGVPHEGRRGRPGRLEDRRRHGERPGFRRRRGHRRSREYLDGPTTAFINWPIVASTYRNEPYPTAGLIYANQPWSGWYDQGRTLWAIAHTTQVTSPGWKYIDSASGYFGGNRANGSYITYQAPDHGDYSVVAETLDATASRDVTFDVTGGLPASAQVHVWASDFGSGNMSDYWVSQSDISPSGGSFTATLKPGYAYSFTTLSTTGRGTAASPPQAPLALPYGNGFESDTPGHEPQYLAQQQGAFETVACPGGRSGQCVRQMAPTQPIVWAPGTTPFTLVGSLGWTDCTVSVDAYLEQAGAVQVIGRADDAEGGHHHGTRHQEPAPTALSFQGSTITAKIDGSTVGSVTDTSYSAGLAGLGVAAYQTEDFDGAAVRGGPAGEGGCPEGQIGHVHGAGPGVCVSSTRRGRRGLSVPDGSVSRPRLGQSSSFGTLLTPRAPRAVSRTTAAVAASWMETPYVLVLAPPLLR
ncbi:galactosylceramidase [Streptomyces sp. NPDC057253]|uniref:galactosylceramidase n=1 Tax=Streptomyces sp. NPDC057253 TaxID=3346069 RepID=UPI003624C823